jgi:U2 small nuclear ribonucleoprotein A'|tara:strand:+ start:285 stop:692 length:408 start_codon:yes stop_codon:yes gene_type:complete
MVKITAELIQRSPVVFNPLGDRELILRGLKIPSIRNLGVTQDQFDSIDLSDNDVQILGNFPKQTRLTTVQLNDNRISSVEGQSMAEALPNLTRLILNGNVLAGLEDLDELAHLKSVGASLLLLLSSLFIVLSCSL